MKKPLFKIDFDDKDLAMIIIGVLALVIGGILVFKGHVTEGAAIGSNSITALGSLAVGRKNGNQNKPNA